MVEFLIIAATATVLLRAMGSKAVDIMNAAFGRESERMQKWRHRHGADFRPSGFSRYLDEAWADAAQRLVDGRADRARRRAEYGYNPGAWALLRTWHAEWWAKWIDKAAKRHGDRVAAGRRERGEDGTGTGLGVIFDVNAAGPGGARTGTEGSLGDHTVPDPQPQPSRPSPEFTPGPQAAGPAEAPREQPADPAPGPGTTRTTTTNDDALFAVLGMMFASNTRTETHGPTAPGVEDPRPASDETGGSEPVDIVDAEVISDHVVIDAKLAKDLLADTVAEEQVIRLLAADRFGGVEPVAKLYLDAHPDERQALIDLYHHKVTQRDPSISAADIEEALEKARQSNNNTNTNTNTNTNEGDPMSGTIATNQPVGGELGTVPRAQAFVGNFDKQLDNAASALEFAMNDLRAAGVTGTLLDALGTVRENCIASKTLLQTAQVELAAHASIGEHYRATPGAGEKAYVAGE